MSDIDQEDLELEDQEGAPNLTNVLEQAIRAHTKDLRVFQPGKIVAVSGDRVSVQLCVQGANTETPEAVLRDVRLCYPGSNLARLAFRVVPGDDVLVLFADRSLDEWDRAGGGSVQASDPRTHDISDAVAVPVNLTAGVSLGILETLEQICDFFINNAATLCLFPFTPIFVPLSPPVPCVLNPAVVVLFSALKAQIDVAKV